MILAVDPGDTTGIAWWRDNGDFLGKAQIPLEELPQTWGALEAEFDEPIRVAIVEDFILFGKRAQSQTGSRMKASQGIGMIKAMCSQGNRKCVVQRADKKIIALKWSQIKMPSDHAKTHEWDAYLHGYFYLVSEGLIKTPLELMKEKEKERNA